MGIDIQTDILKALYSNETEDMQPNFNDVKKVASEIEKVVIVANALIDSIFTTVNDNIADIKINASQAANITILADMSASLQSLVDDKTKLDSLFLDKPTLDGLYALKDKIDSLYADRDNHASLVADKSKLDVLYTNLTKLITIFDNLSILQSIESNLPAITNVDLNKPNINEVAALSPKISTVVANILDIQNAEENAQLALTTKDEVQALRNETEEFRNQAQVIAGGDINASSVKFTDLTDLQAWKTNTAQSIIDLQALLLSDDTTLDQLQEVVDFIKQNKSDLQNLGISNIAGLQADLDAKTLAITNLQNNLTALQNTVTNLDLSNIAETATYKKFTATLLSKLNGIEVGANKYIHPSTHAITEISGLETALEDKSNTNHTHALKTINGEAITGSGNINTPTVELSSAIDSASETKAATPLAVKTVAELANSKLGAPNYVAGNYYTAEKSGKNSNSTNYQKVAEFYIPYAGVIRTLMTLSTDGTNGFGIIYKDNVAVGIQRDTGASYTEDFTVSAGTYIRLYIKKSGNLTGTITGSLQIGVSNPIGIV